MLDEVGELPGPLQVKLLRALQEREIRRLGETRGRRVDVRLIAATQRDLEEDVRGGRFREDLYYRLNVVRIHVPPLRERAEDLPGLLSALVEKARRRSGRTVTVAPDALAAIQSLSWPGNVRELENAIERAAVLSSDGVIRADGFQDLHTGRPADQRAGDLSPRRAAEPPNRLSGAVARAEREAIERALEAAGGNRGEAARSLGVSVRSLFYKLKRLGL